MQVLKLVAFLSREIYPILAGVGASFKLLQSMAPIYNTVVKVIQLAIHIAVKYYKKKDMESSLDRMSLHELSFICKREAIHRI